MMFIETDEDCDETDIISTFSSPTKQYHAYDREAEIFNFSPVRYFQPTRSDDDITTIISPKKQGLIERLANKNVKHGSFLCDPIPDQSTFNTDEEDIATCSTVPNACIKKRARKLSKQLKRTLIQQEASTRGWDYFLKKDQSYSYPCHQDMKTMDLVIEKSIQLINRDKSNDINTPILTICTSFQLINGDGSNDDNDIEIGHKLVMFKPKFHTDTDEGTQIRLYQPWQECWLPEIGEVIIYCTDVYKLCDPNEFRLSSNVIARREFMKPDVRKKMSKLFEAASDDLQWENVIPYSFWNPRTTAKQEMNKVFVDLDVVICEVWTDDNHIRILVHDSDKILSFIDGIQKSEEILKLMKSGTNCRLKKLKRIDQVTAETWLPLFSVLATFNLCQAQVYMSYSYLRFEPNSSMEFLELNAIKFVKPDCAMLTTTQILQISHENDCRVRIQGILGNMTNSEISLSDKFGAIKISMLSAFQLPGRHIRVPIVLNFLRVFRGIYTLDQFSLCRTSANEEQNSIEFDSLP